jgi:hypothetical protein
MTGQEPDIYFLPPIPSQPEVDAFVIAAGVGKEREVAAFLGKYPAAVDQKNIHGNTALIHAAWSGQDSMVALLLDKGAALDLKSGSGLTALMAAALKDRSGVARILLEKDAAIDMSNDKGKTALMIALEQKYPETAALIGQHAETRQRRAQEITETESKKITAARLEKLKNRRPPKPPLK